MFSRAAKSCWTDCRIVYAMSISLENLEDELRKSPHQWRWHAAQVIGDVPSGHLCSYGVIAAETNRRTGLRISPRNVAWLRRHLYDRTNRKTAIPLHRLAKAGDTSGGADSQRTRDDERALRMREGSWERPQWWIFQ